MTVVTPHNAPTSQLPPIGKIKSCSIDELLRAVRYLRLLYNPEVRGTRRIGQSRLFPEANETEAIASILKPERCQARDPSYEAVTSAEQSSDAISSDEFERAYAIRWLTSLISQADHLPQCDESILDESQLELQTAQRETLIEDAAALLAICAGTASAGTVSRVFSFPLDTDPIVKVQLRDAPLENHDYCSVGAQTWGSACLLAEMIVDSPAQFGLHNAPPMRPLRILELGAGTGLVTLTVAQLLHRLWSGKFATHVDIVATDFHPSVLKNLQHNVTINTASPNVQTRILDWSKFPLSPHSPPFDLPFDIIFGADVIYEADHARWIRDCLQILLQKPDGCQPQPCFHLLIPLRPTHQAESRTIDYLFPSGPAFIPNAGSLYSSPPILGILRKDVIFCESGVSVRSRASASDVVEYIHYTVGWISSPPTDDIVL